MAIYVSKEDEKDILFRIPFTVYFIWRDPEYNKFRLVVKEFKPSEMFSDNNEEYVYLVV